MFIDIFSKKIDQIFGFYPVPLKIADKNYDFKQNMLILWSFVILTLISLSFGIVIYYGDFVFATTSTAGNFYEP